MYYDNIFELYFSLALRCYWSCRWRVLTVLTEQKLVLCFGERPVWVLISECPVRFSALCCKTHVMCLDTRQITASWVTAALMCVKRGIKRPVSVCVWLLCSYSFFKKTKLRSAYSPVQKSESFLIFSHQWHHSLLTERGRK